MKNPRQPDRDLRFKHFVLFNYSPKIFLISASISSELMIFPSCSVVTGLHKGTVFVRLKIGVNAVAHSRYDNRMPGKKDKVSFVVTRIDEERNVVFGLISRIIKQNI